MFKTVADPFAGRINLFRVLKGTVTADSTLVNLRAKSKERMGTLLEVQGKEHHAAHDFGEGDLGVRREAQGRARRATCSSTRRSRSRCRTSASPSR